MLGDTTTSLILVVEDDAQLRQTLHDVLEFAGHGVIAARGGLEALSLLRESEVLPGLIVSDIVMHKMDGLQLLDAVHAEDKWRHIPFMFLSGQDTLDTVHPVMGVRAVRYLTKPFKVPELLAMIEDLLKPAPPRTEIEIKFEIAGLEIPPDELDHVVDNDMLVAAMKRMGETIREELGGMICPVHNLPPFVTVSLSSTEGLRTHIDGCCTQIVQITTAPLKEALKQTAPFGSHMTLVIYVEDSTEPLVFEAHQIDELVFGRADPRADLRPEIDLTAHQGAAKGVSRRHARIIWWHGALHIVDEDSANGTYLNGHGLAPQEHYLLRNGDEIRLGDLALRLEFVTDD